MKQGNLYAKLVFSFLEVLAYNFLHPKDATQLLAGVHVPEVH